MAYRSVLRSLLTAMGIVLLANRLQKARSRMAESERRAASGAAEARLLAEELNLLIDGAHGHAIYLLDAEGKVAIWNHGALRLFRSEEHTSELQSLMRISYDAFFLTNKNLRT